jgi:hypothetical protein
MRAVLEAIDAALVAAAAAALGSIWHRSRHPRRYARVRPPTAGFEPRVKPGSPRRG